MKKRGSLIVLIVVLLSVMGAEELVAVERGQDRGRKMEQIVEAKEGKSRGSDKVSNKESRKGGGKRGESEKGGEAQLTFEKLEHDFGEIDERGKKESYEFVFRNSGDCPLVLTRSIISCKCVNVNFSKRPVAPGEEGVVTVTYNPRKQQGVFYKTIQIYSNAPERVHFITIKGVVVDR